MAAHSIWTGSISFGLVSIPVSLRTAVEDHDLKFSLLDKHDHAPVGYLHVNKKTGKEVKWEDIIKGYEYEDGKYVVLSPDDFRKANVKANQLLEIEDFVALDEVAPTFLDKPYYIVPTAAGAKAYALLRDALARTNKVGIGRVVMHTKLHLTAVVPLGEVLLLEILRFPHEVRDEKSLDLPKSQSRIKTSAREIAMAEQLIASMTSSFAPKKYKDTYHDDLLRLIQKKIKLGDTAEVEPYNEPPEELVENKGKIIDLMPLLKASLSRRHLPGRGAAQESDEPEEEEAAAKKPTAAQPTAKKSTAKKSTAARSTAKKPTAKTSTANKPAARRGQAAPRARAASASRAPAHAARRSAR